MQVQDITHTNQLNWQLETHCFGACAVAAKQIVNGETVKFDIFRRSKEESTRLTYVKSIYVGLYEIDGSQALRVSHCTDLDAHKTHSLIASWSKQATDPVFISARLAVHLMREGSDWFINAQIQ